MIRRNARSAIAYQLGFLNTQRPFEVDMIEVDHRQQTGIAPPLPDVQLEIEAFEPVRKHARGQAFDPFVEISHQNTRA